MVAGAVAAAKRWPHLCLLRDPQWRKVVEVEVVVVVVVVLVLPDKKCR